MFRIKDFLFKNKTIRQTILKNIFWQVVAQGGGKIIRAGVIIYAARTLGVEEYGSFTYAANVVALFTIIADLAIDPILTREI
ncbi:MAG: oligosaccharide flippase family protein, partial [bacterium]|nr:oligosaccharide flippase family protein [bacterium]